MKTNLKFRKKTLSARRRATIIKNACALLANEKTVTVPKYPEVAYRTHVGDRFFISIQFSTEYTEPDYMVIQFNGKDVFQFSENSKPKVTLFDTSGWEAEL